MPDDWEMAAFSRLPMRPGRPRYELFCGRYSLPRSTTTRNPKLPIFPERWAATFQRRARGAAEGWGAGPTAAAQGAKGSGRGALRVTGR